MKKVFYLKTCDTCRKIMSEFDLKDWQLRDIKTKALTKEELSEMVLSTKSYKNLFSKRSTEIKKRNLNPDVLSENDMKDLILDHYSFLKRPVFLTEKEIFVGNDKLNLEQLRNYFQNH